MTTIFSCHLLCQGFFLLAVVIIEESVTLRELGRDVCDVACEQQQISRLYFQSEPHECHGIYSQGCSHFAANDFRMLLRVGYGRYRYHPVEYWTPEVCA